MRESNFISIHDVADPQRSVKQALELKKDPWKLNHIGKNKTLGMFFFNPSLRTRLSTAKAAQLLGMNALEMNATSGWVLEFEEDAVMDGDKAEHIVEAAGVLSGYCDVLGVRTFAALQDKEEDYGDKVIHAFTQHSSVPVVSLESAIRHPLQSLADMMTIEEHRSRKQKPKVVLTWAPHPRVLPQAVANSFAEWALAMDYNLTITHPDGFALDSQFTQGATLEANRNKAFEGADFVYAKNWCSMSEYGTNQYRDESWMVDTESMARTSNAFFMHCLPVRRNVVVESKILTGDNSLVFQQSNNRTFSAMHVLKNLITDNSI